jgi:ABC-type transport system involved in cytochrome c biogenesis permease subunit
MIRIPLLSILSFILFLSLPAIAKDSVAAPAESIPDLNTEIFSSLPVLQEGRMKPMDSLARIALKTLSGQERIQNLNARQWLIEVLFDPGSAIARPIFFVEYPEQLGLPRVRGRLYTYQQVSQVMESHRDSLASAMQKDSKQWTDEEQNLIQTQEKILIFEQLSHSFSFLLPLRLPVPQSVVQQLDLPKDKPITLLDLERHREEIDSRAQRIIKRKGEDEKNYTAQEKAFIDLAFSLSVFNMKGQENKILRVIPPLDADKDPSWVSPWSILTQGAGSPQNRAFTNAWQMAAISYLEDNPAEWDAAMKTLQDLYGPYVDQNRLTLEIVYNHIDPYDIAMILYGLAFLSFCVWAGLQKPILYRSGSVFLALGMVIHIAAIGVRMFLLERPPVGTLYESLLFVAAIVALIGLVWDLKTSNRYGLFTGSLGALIILFAAQGFTDHDTLKMLVAVLNTNFWLATHVLCITIGYAWCVITAMTAHIMLFREMRGQSVSHLKNALQIFTITSLLFVSVGTILGGIWADQSWGRFWGWDPKENGALLIALWIAWLLHGKMSGMIDKNAYLAGLAALNILVALTWFGVNLLNVGLHSYGFISGVAGSLGAFCAIQTAIILYLWRGAHRQHT